MIIIAIYADCFFTSFDDLQIYCVFHHQIKKKMFSGSRFSIQQNRDSKIRIANCRTALINAVAEASCVSDRFYKISFFLTGVIQCHQKFVQILICIFCQSASIIFFNRRSVKKTYRPGIDFNQFVFFHHLIQILTARFRLINNASLILPAVWSILFCFENCLLFSAR